MVPRDCMTPSYSHYTASSDFSGNEYGMYEVGRREEQPRKCIIFEEKTLKHAGLSAYRKVLYIIRLTP